MVSYASMTDAEIEKYREESIKESKKRQEEWKKEHPDVDSSCRTPFDVQHHIYYPIR
jgi:hypothetical protein